MLDRTFTPAEANNALGEVRPAAERLVRTCERLRDLGSDQGRLVTAIGGNGEGHAAGDLGAARSELASVAAEVAACMAVLESLGVLVKDADLGLVDFPALRAGEPVLLCWHVGEDAVTHWHSYDEGYAGRKPIDWGEEEGS
ncbi:MAG TPA: DUF2203 domain-containing protein [Gaiellaceae bacterium]|nr:DUF2203 domain-containing protein [Gaiellaceae bacterium]